MRMPGQVGAVNQKRTNREKYRLRDWLVGNEIKSPACKRRTAGQHPSVLTRDRIIYDQIARGRDARQQVSKTPKSRLAKSSKVSRESIAADAPPSRRAPPDKSGSMPEDDDAGHKHSRDKREEATSTTGGWEGGRVFLARSQPPAAPNAEA
ncbi:hypothetical protein ALC57_03456 [Trachymyrmex cornetzi]|uniref:Uncharacterized protein n=1 Tax=Trachymyrmex cornetzi TaxID=471704 RepID=A0A195EFU5_9HYME|nr:hypothetical protein ALC57_03456 [Trachymyrmex cornetzi]